MSAPKVIRAVEVSDEKGFLAQFVHKVIIAGFVALLFFSLPPMVSGQGHGHNHDHHDHEKPPSFKYSRDANAKAHSPPDSSKTGDQERMEMWLHALGSTLLVSLAPILILFVIPLDNSPGKKPFLKILLAFASGGLLGDAFLHLIPHALMGQGHSEEPQGNGHSHGHSHSHGHGAEVNVGIWVLAGILIFLFVEKFIRLVKGGHSHSHAASEKDMPKEKSGKGDKKSEKTAGTAHSSAAG